MKKVLVIYHREDNDGACSAGIIGAFLKHFPLIGGSVIPPNEIEFYGVNYADLSRDWEAFTDWTEHEAGSRTPKMAKWHKYEHIFMVDISFNSPKAMLHMKQQFQDRFTWCDHHAPIIRASETEGFSDVPGLRTTVQSALINTWEWLSGQVEAHGGIVPLPSKWLRELSDYDSWAWSTKPEYETPEAQEQLFSLNTGITRRSDLDPKWFMEWTSHILDGHLPVHERIAEESRSFGNVVYRLDIERVARAISSNGDTKWVVALAGGEERRACALVTTDRINSRSFAGFKGTDIVHGIDFNYHANTDSVTMSLYNVNDDDDFDCGAFLKARYQGGGHKGAAGCTLTREQFAKIFMDRKI